MEERKQAWRAGSGAWASSVRWGKVRQEEARSQRPYGSPEEFKPGTAWSSLCISKTHTGSCRRTDWRGTKRQEDLLGDGCAIQKERS